MLETWKDIPEYESIYQVSCEGRVRSLDRDVDAGRYVKKGVVLKTRLDSDGYCIVDLSKDGSKKTFKVHFLVIFVFKGSSIFEDAEVDHINGKRNDNCLSNLRWLSDTDNKLNRHVCLGASGIVGVRYRKGKKNPWQAYAGVNGVWKSLGHFKDSESAARAREEFGRVSHV